MSTKLTVFFLLSLSFGLMSPNCDHQNDDLPKPPSVILSATCSYPNGKFLYYSTNDVHLKTSEVVSGLDTLYIDSEDGNGKWIAVGLLCDDVRALTPGNYNITGNQVENEVWLVHYNSDIDTEVFWPNAAQGGGVLKIESFDFNTKKIKATFNCAINTGTVNGLAENGVIRIE